MGAEWSRGDPPAPMLVSLAWVGGRGRRWDPDVPWEGVAMGCAAALPCWGGGGSGARPPHPGRKCAFAISSLAVCLRRSQWLRVTLLGGRQHGGKHCRGSPPKWLWFPLQGGQQWPPPVSEGLWGWWDLK